MVQKSEYSYCDIFSAFAVGWTDFPAHQMVTPLRLCGPTSLFILPITQVAFSEHRMDIYGVFIRTVGQFSSSDCSRQIRGNDPRYWKRLHRTVETSSLVHAKWTEWGINMPRKPAISIRHTLTVSNENPVGQVAISILLTALAKRSSRTNSVAVSGWSFSPANKSST